MYFLFCIKSYAEAQLHLRKVNSAADLESGDPAAGDGSMDIDELDMCLQSLNQALNHIRVSTIRLYQISSPGYKNVIVFKLSLSGKSVVWQVNIKEKAVHILLQPYSKAQRRMEVKLKFKYQSLSKLSLYPLQT